ncbi:MAG: GAF domain-containing protein [Bacteroidaceae bacterium]|nr:GAF domain-containing protein [Bacteroidaceae bacterium]
MAEHLEIANGSKADKYAALLPQIKSVVEDEPDPIACMANVASMLHETFGFWWTGFYRVIDLQGAGHTQELVLGPFQGPLACTRIRKGRGVCGTAWAEDQTMVVPDVNQFPGHIACSSASKSEIVVPLHNAEGHVTAVLDIDSDQFATFDETDKHWLEKIAELL